MQLLECKPAIVACLLHVSPYSRVGAAIVVDVQEYSVPLSDLAGNPQCFLVYEKLRARPDQWDDVSMCMCACVHVHFLLYALHNVTHRTHAFTFMQVKIVFQGNSAMVGSVIYASFLNSCSWFNNNITTKIFDINEFLQWRVFEMG